MNKREAQQMAELLTRECGSTPVSAYQNVVGQWVVRVEWTTGPVHFVSVRECAREANWLHKRGGPGGAWVKKATDER